MYYWIFCFFIFNLYSQGFILNKPITRNNKPSITRPFIQDAEYMLLAKIAEAEKLNNKLSISFEGFQEGTLLEEELKKSTNIRNNQIKNLRNIYITTAGLSAAGFFYLNKMVVESKLNGDADCYENLKYLITASHYLVVCTGAVGAKYAFEYARRKKSEFQRTYISPFPYFIKNLLLRYRR